MLPGARPCLVHESSGPAAADAGARRRGESHPPAGLGLDPAATPPAFLIAADPATERRMETLLGGNRSTPLGSLVGVNSGSSDAGQRWPTEAFRRLGDELAVRLDAGTP